MADDALSWSDRTASAPAVVQEGRIWTYGDLAQRSCAIAAGLLGRGLEPGDVVGVTGQRSFGLIASMLGVLRSGGVLLTLDRALPAERRRLMLSEARVRWIVRAGPSAEEDSSPSGPLPVIPVDGDGLLAQGETLASGAPLPRVCANDPAYIFFTSGTSGVPRAVLGSQKGLSHFLRWQREEFEIGPGDRCAHLTGLSFDVVLRDVFLPLTSGASLHLPGPLEEPGSSGIVSWLEREGITALHTVPSLAQSWLAAPLPDAGLARLRWIFFAGEPLSDALVRRWVSAFPGAGRIVNLYGPTETTLAKCFFVVPEDPPAGIQPIGGPLPDTQALILTEGARLCGIGEMGEIVLRTPFRSLGYLNAPREQQSRFVPNPFRMDEDDVLYRTGDRGRYRLDGSLEILGRWDDQVKIRGVRVEPAEVAAVLFEHRLVEGCAVVPRMDDPEGPTLVAYVVGPRQGLETAAELRSHLSARLPAAMVPSTVVFLEELPLTANGKLDRTALPPPELAMPARAEPLELPRTQVEEVVAAIWTSILGVERIGIQENFFELGGHSLKATRVMSRVNRAFRLDLPVRELFENPTLATLSSAIERFLFDQWKKAARGGMPADVSVGSPSRTERRTDQSDDREVRRARRSPGGISDRSDSRPRAPLSYAQERLWVLDRLDPGLSFYNIGQAFWLRGRLDVKALRRALEGIVQRHEVLRSVYVMEEGNPAQVVELAGEQALPVMELGDLSEEVREEQIHRMVEEEARVPFDLSRGRLVRTKLLRVSEQEHVLVVTIHHIVFDGWSNEIFRSELSVLYEAYREGRPSPLPELSIQYADFARWQREWLEGEVLEGQLSYWKRQLDGAPAVLELPGSRVRPSRQSFRGATESVTIPRAVSEAIRGLGQREGATLFMTLLAAFKVLLLRHTGQEDIVVGTPVAGRNRSDIEGLIGFFVNTLVLRTDLSGDPTFRELLGRVREVALEGYAHQDLPFEKLVEALNPERTLAHSPIFQVMMLLQNAADDAGLRLAGVSVTPMPLRTETAKFDLTASLTDTGKEIAVSFQYNTDLFEASTVKRMLSHLGVLLEAIAEDPDRRVSRLPLLTAEERHQVLVEWNRTETPYPREKTVHGLFEEQAERTPEAVAVEFEGERLTYGELNERANRLARYLSKRGVGPEVLVGLCVERSLEMVVGLLGILKAGGAYLPLDPGYPRERLRFMVEDAGAPFVLTQERLENSLPEGTPRVRLDADWTEIARESGENPQARATPQNLAYVIYTSGSTGKPKGVEIEHGSLANHVWCVADRFGTKTGERVLQFASLNFDASVQEIFSALTRGAALVLRTEEMIGTVATFLARCREWSVTVLDLPTSYWHELVAVASAEHLELPESLRFALIGGERALPERFAQWQELTGGKVQLLNAYGPTEATIAATFWQPKGLVDPLPRIVPIGRPIANVRVYVLDGRLEPVPVGVVGELYVGGACPARGYRNRPELTAEKFISDPFGGARDRLYRTGDRVRFRDDGELEYLGRVDGQVKLRGFRVEPGEIESALREIQGVSDAVVRAREDVPGQTRLIGYVVADPARPVSVGEMRRLLKERLPEYMVPSVFVLLDALPRTRSGKLDAAALPAPEPARPELDNMYCGPRTPAEETLTEIWKNVLRLDRVGVHDNFFELGGHSLLATQVISRVRDVFHADVPLRELFMNPTVAELALAIAERQAGRVEPAELESLLSGLKTRAAEPSPEGR